MMHFSLVSMMVPKLNHFKAMAHNIGRCLELMVALISRMNYPLSFMGFLDYLIFHQTPKTPTLVSNTPSFKSSMENKCTVLAVCDFDAHLNC